MCAFLRLYSWLSEVEVLMGESDAAAGGTAGKGRHRGVPFSAPHH